MVYISSNGTVDSTKSKRRWSIRGFFNGIIEFIGIFFGSVTRQPQRLRESPSSTYTQRHGVRRPNNQYGGGARLGGQKSSNIRGVKDVGACNIPGGGGG